MPEFDGTSVDCQPNDVRGPIAGRASSPARNQFAVLHPERTTKTNIHIFLIPQSHHNDGDCALLTAQKPLCCRLLKFLLLYIIYYRLLNRKRTPRKWRTILRASPHSRQRILPRRRDLPVRKVRKVYGGRMLRPLLLRYYSDHHYP